MDEEITEKENEQEIGEGLELDEPICELEQDYEDLPQQDEANENEQDEASEDEAQAPIPQEFVQRANEELRALGARVSIAPSSLEELENHPKIGEMSLLWQKGCSITEAYFAVCASDILERESKIAYQHALNTIRGKSHLEPMGNVSGVMAVPTEVKSAFKKMCPELTDAQISKEYKKYLADL